MLNKMIFILMLPALFALTNCTSEKTGLVRDNPKDPGGTSGDPYDYVTVMADTSVTTNDSFYIHAKGKADSGRSILKYLWALDGITYNKSTDSGWIKTAFADPGSKIVLVKIRDDSGIVSLTADTCKIKVTAAHIAGMKYITSGTFSMGQTGIATPVHNVTLSGFYIDSTEVTQADYLALMGVNPSFNPGNSRRPVEKVTWFDAVLYCNARSKRDKLDTVYSFMSILGKPGDSCSDLGNLTIDTLKRGYRLPTEAEWEYACRAGTTTKCFWGNDSSAGGSYAWSSSNSGYLSHPVASLLPNAWGLYDMAGNVWEWCGDWYGSYNSASQTNPTGAKSGTYRVLRGGSWFNGDDALRSAAKTYEYPGIGRYSNFGFRCVKQ